jgi:type IV secretory pathway TrbF-like protein
MKMTADTKPDRTFNTAKQLYAEQFGDSIVTNTYLKIALLAMALVSAGLIYTNLKTVRMVQNFKPLVIRISDIGRAEAVRYDTLGYKPQEAEIKYFLSEFCRLYYSRNHNTIRDNVKKSLLFMDAQLANSVTEAYGKNHTVEGYLEDSSGPDIDIEVEKVSIEDLRLAPYKATVDFYEVAYSPGDRVEVKRTLYTAHFVFLFRDSVPNDLIQVNPLGLAFTYFREDEAFYR